MSHEDQTPTTEPLFAAIEKETCPFGEKACAGGEWEDLTQTDDPGVRVCEHCQGRVHLSRSYKQFNELEARGCRIAGEYNGGIEY
jgi:hypothetical protein